MPDVEIGLRLAKKISSARRDQCKLEDSTTADGASRLAANARPYISPAACHLHAARSSRTTTGPRSSGRLRLHRREIPLEDLVCIIVQAGIEIFPAVYLHDGVNGICGRRSGTTAVFTCRGRRRASKARVRYQTGDDLIAYCPQESSPPGPQLREWAAG